MIYLIVNESKTVCKIGFTTNDPQQRLKELQTANAEKLFVRYCITGSVNIERNLHKLFSSLRLNGEWFTYHKAINNYFESKKEFYVENCIIENCTNRESLLLKYLIFYCEKYQTDLFCVYNNDFVEAQAWIRDNYSERINRKHFSSLVAFLIDKKQIDNVDISHVRINKKHLSSFFAVDIETFKKPFETIEKKSRKYNRNRKENNVMCLSSKIPFGKYKGEILFDVLKKDEQYIFWFVGYIVDIIDDELQKYLDDLRKRKSRL